MFGKIVAISTVKHLSRNYASFQQPSVQEWYSLSTSGQAQNIPQRNTADFHGDGYILQNTGHEAEEISFVVCDVNSEKEQLQVKIFVLKNRRKLWRCEDRIGFMPQTKNREKTVNMHKFIFQTDKSTFSCPCESLCSPVCDFKTEVEVVTHNRIIEPCWGNVKDMIS